MPVAYADLAHPRSAHCELLSCQFRAGVAFLVLMGFQRGLSGANDVGGVHRARHEACKSVCAHPRGAMTLCGVSRAPED